MWKGPFFKASVSKTTRWVCKIGCNWHWKRVQKCWQKSRAPKMITKFKIVVNLLNTCWSIYHFVKESTCLLRKGLYLCITCSVYINRPLHHVAKIGKYDIVNFIMLKNVKCGKNLLIQFLIMTLTICNHCIQYCSIGFQFRTIIF